MVYIFFCISSSLRSCLSTIPNNDNALSRTISFCIITYNYRLRSIGYGFTVADNNTTNSAPIGCSFTNNNLVFCIALSSIAYDYTVRIAFITFTYYDSISRTLNSIS